MDPNVSEDVSISETGTAASTGVHLGALIGTARAACRQALETRGCTRVYELYLRLEIQCDETVLGKVHALLSQKRTQIQREDLDEKTGDWTFEARIPASETVDLSAELRRCSSGKASILLSVEGWRLNPQEPFPECVLSAEDEQDDGLNLKLAIASNVSRGLIFSVRKRKGLSLGEKIVESGDKQRTLGRSK
eukprot:Protomagalhaensia_sp_Gyna_25__4488@NODE_411_length_3520_cov_4_601264_g317_i0_p2_GENE_NODE_411_length_3520_cov_4_601264_g317_i0NODE_411_length_3520_cov_4_601264_g317_i0_p2_ORF_typecomplete_len192_score43_78EFG_C/PF00679_24/2_5e15_NODE_411_length_3520_cov_4_601264_g317_i025903165